MVAKEKAIKRTALVLELLGLLVGSEVRAEGPEQWQFGLTPYLWLPQVDAHLGYETAGPGGSTAEMTNILDHLKAALFLNAVATKGAWGLSLDIVYCDFSKSTSEVTSIVVPGLGVESPLNAGTTTDLTGSMFSLLGTFALRRSSSASFDLLAGVRYTHIASTLDWSFSTSTAGLPARMGSAGMNADLWDGVVGVRGRVRLADSRWYMPLYLDAGTGTSEFTWQGMVGIGYQFGWGDLLAVYRHLSFDVHDGQGVQQLSLSGPALGVTFRF